MQTQELYLADRRGKVLQIEEITELGRVCQRVLKSILRWSCTLP